MKITSEGTVPSALGTDPLLSGHLAPPHLLCLGPLGGNGDPPGEECLAPKAEENPEG